MLCPVSLSGIKPGEDFLSLCRIARLSKKSVAPLLHVLKSSLAALSFANASEPKQPSLGPPVRLPLRKAHTPASRHHVGEGGRGVNETELVVESEALKVVDRNDLHFDVQTRVDDALYDLGLSAVVARAPCTDISLVLPSAVSLALACVKRLSGSRVRQKVDVKPARARIGNQFATKANARRMHLRCCPDSCIYISRGDLKLQAFCPQLFVRQHAIGGYIAACEQPLYERRKLSDGTPLTKGAIEVASENAKT